LAKGSVDVGRFDAGRSRTGGREPGRLGQEIERAQVAVTGFGEEIDRGGSEDIAGEAGATNVPVEIGGNVFARQGMELMDGAYAAEDGALDREPQAFEQVIVSEQDEGEGAALTAPKAQEHAEFLQSRCGVVLCIVEGEHKGDGLNVGEVFFKREEVAAAFEARAFAELGEQDLKHPGGRKRGLGNEQGQVSFGFEPAHPGFEQRAFSGAGGTGEHHHSAQGGGGVELEHGFAAACGMKGVGAFVIWSEWYAQQAPCAQEFIKGGVFGSGVFSGHSYFLHCRFGC